MISKLTDDDLRDVVRAVKNCNGSLSAAARALNMTRNQLSWRMRQAQIKGLAETDPDGDGLPPSVLSDEAPPEDAAAPAGVDPHALRRALREGKHGLDALASVLKTTRGQVLDGIDLLREQGYKIEEGAGRYWLDTKPQAATDENRVHEYSSREDGSYLFGFTSDNHLGSKYARQDVLDDLFRHFVEVGVDRVFNAGNWIDGEASFNKHDLTVRGMHGQCVHLAEHWPNVGIDTYAVTGDDHEGWYAQREGVDVGAYAEQCFRKAGRTDWHDLGFMEADIALVHAGTGVRTRLRVAHPGGGSAYATSYAPQKYIEALDGGDKPAVVLLGHWHKMELLNIRNVWTLQTGCTQDQTPFGRKKRLDFHVGGGICRLVQDPETGAITRCTVEFLRYFNRAYYGSGRWSHHGDVRMAQRSPT